MKKIKILTIALLSVFLLTGCFKRDNFKVRASYVCENALYEYSNKIGLTENIRVGNGVSVDTPSIVADCLNP